MGGAGANGGEVMRLRLTANVAGEIRVVSLPDRRRAPLAVAAGSPLLVSSSEFPDARKVRTGRASAGYGVVSTGTAFGKHAKTVVREVGALLDARPKHQMVFLTGTLPGSTVAAVESIAAWSGWMVATLKQWFRDAYPGSQAFGVWEYQQRGALHLHVCVWLPIERQVRDLLGRWKARWIALLDGVCEKSGVDLYGRKDGSSWSTSKWVTRTDSQRVEKSVRCYLSKYLSKGGDVARDAAIYPPSRWWFCDRALLRQARRARLELEVTLLSLADVRTLTVKVADQIARLCQKSFAYESPVDARVQGYVGYTQPVAASMLFQSLGSLLGCLSPELGVLRHSQEVAPPAVAVFFHGKLIEGYG